MAGIHPLRACTTPYGTILDSGFKARMAISLDGDHWFKSLVVEEGEEFEMILGKEENPRLDIRRLRILKCNIPLYARTQHDRRATHTRPHCRSQWGCVSYQMTLHLPSTL